MSTLLQLAYFHHGSDYAMTAAAVGSLLVFLGIMFVIMIIVYVIVALLLSRIFQKAGVPAWIAWVPFYNMWKTLELGDQQGFWAVLAIIPFVNYVSLVFLYIAMYKIGLRFGKESWFVVLAIFVPIVWYAWLALDNSKWAPVKKA